MNSTRSWSGWWIGGSLAEGTEALMSATTNQSETKRAVSETFAIAINAKRSLQFSLP